jgi:hypothetical protein
MTLFAPVMVHRDPIRCCRLLIAVWVLAPGMEQRC